MRRTRPGYDTSPIIILLSIWFYLQRLFFTIVCGANWVIVDKGNRDVVVSIDHTRESISKMSADESKRYLSGTPAHRSQSTADSLKNFIKQ